MAFKILLFFIITLSVSSVFTKFRLSYSQYPKIFQRIIRKKIKFFEDLKGWPDSKESRPQDDDVRHPRDEDVRPPKPGRGRDIISRVPPDEDKVRIQLFYESHCPYSRKFYEYELTPTVKKLGNKLEVLTYPYGNAQTEFAEDGNFIIKCQHGQAECYGNKLHACAIEKTSTVKEAVLFNSCLMDDSQKKKGSDDEACEKCQTVYNNIDIAPIETCAKGSRGKELHAFYGEESKKVSFKSVPYVLINGKEYNGNNFMQEVCSCYRRMPQECIE